MDCTNTNFEEVYQSIAKHLPSVPSYPSRLSNLFTGQLCRYGPGVYRHQHQ